VLREAEALDIGVALERGGFIAQVESLARRAVTAIKICVCVST